MGILSAGMSYTMRVPGFRGSQQRVLTSFRIGHCHGLWLLQLGRASDCFSPSKVSIILSGTIEGRGFEVSSIANLLSFSMYSEIGTHVQPLNKPKATAIFYPALGVTSALLINIPRRRFSRLVLVFLLKSISPIVIILISIASFIHILLYVLHIIV